MPQMAPYNWLILFIMFNIMMIYLLSLIYFMNLPTTTEKKNNKLLYNYNWKW